MKTEVNEIARQIALNADLLGHFSETCSGFLRFFSALQLLYLLHENKR